MLEFHEGRPDWDLGLSDGHVWSFVVGKMKREIKTVWLEWSRGKKKRTDDVDVDSHVDGEIKNINLNEYCDPVE